MMKKSMYVLFAFLLSGGSAFAGYGYSFDDRQCCEDGGLRSYTDPCGFYIGLTGAYAVPTETGLGTFTDSWQYQDSDGGVTSLSKPSKAHYDPAGGVLIGYDFPCSATNIEVEYFRLYNSKHNYNDTSDNPISFGSAFFNIGVPLAPGVEFVSDAFLRYTVNQADIKLGHRFITASGCLQLHPSIGVRYVYLVHDLTFLVGHVRSRYQGAGPMFAFDGQYNFCGGFSLVSHFDTSLLMGSVKGNNFLNFGAINRFKSPSTGRLISATGGRLGVAYDYCICNRSTVKIELGYQANLYIGPFDIITGYVEPIQRIANLNTTNFATSGPYLKLSWHM